MEIPSEVRKQFNSKAEKFVDKTSHAIDRAQESMNEIKNRSVEVYDSSVQAVRRNPAAWMGAALGIGVITGLIIGRSRQSQ